MIIPQEVIERVRQAADIVEVIGGYVTLKKAGSSYKALSPFNKEKTPSFYVLPDKQIFKCWSSGHGGDVIKFVMLYENIDFLTAVRRLAERFRIPIPEEPGQSDFSKSERESMLRIHRELAIRWRDMLLHDPRAEVGRAYLHRREIPLSWVNEYTLGYAVSEWDDVLKWGQQQGYSRELLLKAGVAKQNEAGRTYDFFRGRLMFPINDDQGRIIAFSGRLMDEQAKEGKYVNSPDTPLFTKSRVIFAFDRARRAIMDEDKVVLCEGQIDVLRCHSVGIKNVVAPLGTAFTMEHCKLLRRCTRNVILCLDGDGAGQRAVERAAAILLDPEIISGAAAAADLGIQVVRLPKEHDPDSLIVKEGPDAFRAIINQPLDYIDFLLERLIAEPGSDSPDGLRKSVEGIASFIVKVPNAVLKARYLSRASVRLRIPEALIEDVIQAQARSARPPRPETVDLHKGETPPPAPMEKLKVDQRIAALLPLILHQPSLIPLLQRNLNPEWIRGFIGASLVFKIADSYTEDAWNDLADLMGQLSEVEQNCIASIEQGKLASIENRADNFQELDAVQSEKEVQRQLLALENDWLSSQIRLVTEELRNGSLDAADRAKAIQKLNGFSQSKNDLTRRMGKASLLDSTKP